MGRGAERPGLRPEGPWCVCAPKFRFGAGWALRVVRYSAVRRKWGVISRTRSRRPLTNRTSHGRAGRTPTRSQDRRDSSPRPKPRSTTPRRLKPSPLRERSGSPRRSTGPVPGALPVRRDEDIMPEPPREGDRWNSIPLIFPALSRRRKRRRGRRVEAASRHAYGSTALTRPPSDGVLRGSGRWASQGRLRLGLRPASNIGLGLKARFRNERMLRFRPISDARR